MNSIRAVAVGYIWMFSCRSRNAINQIVFDLVVVLLCYARLPSLHLFECKMIGSNTQTNMVLLVK